MFSLLAATALAGTLQASDLTCLAINIYHEARNQPIEGQFAVGEVVLNRIKDSRWPSSVCAVVTQKYNNTCQFSWFCDKESDKPTDAVAWNRAQGVAIFITLAKTNYTNGAVFYHADYVNPYWAHNMVRSARINNHIFYKG